MKTKNLFSFFFLLLIISCNNSPNNSKQFQEKLDKAIGYNDYYTAIYYAHELLALDNKNDSTAFQLAELYKVTKNYAGAIKVANELLPKANTAERIRLWQIKAESFNGSRNHASAIVAYDSLSTLNPSKQLDYSYEIGVLYFQARDIKKGIANMQKVIQDPNSRTTMTNIHSDWGEDKVPYYLAALNYIGYIQIETKQLEEATKTYEEINQAGIPFKLAQGNQKLLEKRKAQVQ